MRAVKAAVLAVALLSPLPTFAQGFCVPVSDPRAFHKKHYGELPVFWGMHSESGASTWAFANPDTGTWSVGTLLPDGRWCMFASGDAWNAMDVPAEPKGDPS